MGAKRSAVLFKNGAEPAVQKIDETDAYLLELRYFIERIQQGKPVDLALPRHSLYVMKVMLAVQDSLETKQVVKL